MSNPTSKERLSHRLLNIAGDLSEIASNPPNEMDSQAMARIASQLIALAGQVRLGEDIDPKRVPAETKADPDDAPDSTDKFAELIEDAAKWRALRNCARITSMGSAGLHDAEKLARPDAHVTLNFWTHGKREEETYPREWLDQFVMKVRRLAQKSEAPLTISKAPQS